MIDRKEAIRALRFIAQKAETIADRMERGELYDEPLFRQLEPIAEKLRSVIDHTR